MEAHLAPEELNSFLQGTSGPQRAASIEAHIDACEECRVLLSSLVRSRPDATNLETQQVLGAWLPVAEGETIAGKYRIERVLGSGGMGVVMAAWHLQLNQRVAIKFMQPSLAADPQAAMRFQREARAAARLQSAHVGKVLDLDALPNGAPFVVMEFLDGEGLDRRLAAQKTLAPTVALEWIRQALTALAEAHALGIVHRDVKPANLFLAKRPDGTELVKVVDFGIAKSADPDIEHGLSSTSSRLMLGSPPYMPPEQFAAGTPISPRADVWAIGVVLYQVLSGRLPFDNENLVDVMYAIRHRPHRPVKEAAAHLAPDVVALIERCLKKDPAARFADARELLEAVEVIVRAGPATVSMPAPDIAAPPKSGAFAQTAAMAFGVVAVLLAGVVFVERDNLRALFGTHKEPSVIVAPPESPRPAKRAELRSFGGEEQPAAPAPAPTAAVEPAPAPVVKAAAPPKPPVKRPPAPVAARPAPAPTPKPAPAPPPPAPTPAPVKKPAGNAAPEFEERR